MILQTLRTVAIAEQDPNISLPNLGLVRVFRFDKTSEDWIQIGDDMFDESAQWCDAWSVSLSGDGSIVAISTPDDPVGAQVVSGHVRVL